MVVTALCSGLDIYALVPGSRLYRNRNDEHPRWPG